MKDYFENVRAGDKIYSLSCGAGIVKYVQGNDIFIDFARGEKLPLCLSCDRKGIIDLGAHQTFFYGDKPPKIEVPPEPRRACEWWVCTTNSGQAFDVYDTEEDALAYKSRIGSDCLILHARGVIEQ